MHVRQVSKKEKKSQKQKTKQKTKKKLNTWDLSTAVLLGHGAANMSNSFCSFTVTSVLRLPKHLNTKEMCSKNNESKQQVTLQIMECEPFLPLSE